MNFKSLENKRVYFAPKNDLSLKLNDYLANKINFISLGYLDSIKDESDVPDISNVDYIIISSPNYYKVINETLNKFISSKKICFCFFNESNEFDLYSSKKIYSLKLFLNVLTSNSKNVNYIQLMKYHNIHKKERAFILGNGPSLNSNDLSSLENEITFAANKIYLAYENTQWRPSYYFVEDHLVYEQNFEEIKKQKEISFFPIDTLPFGKVDNGIYYNFIFENYSPKLPKISSNALRGLYWGGTVVYSMIQMAIYMGIKEIYIIGLDFSFEVPKKDLDSKKDIVSEGEVNHFHKDYRKIGEKWTQPKLDIQELSFQKVRDYCEKNNIKIYNASRKSDLKVLPSIDFDILF